MELTSTQGFKNTEIGDIPMDWDLVKVDDLIDLLTDYDANGSFASVAENVKVYDFEKYAWYVRSTDLENDSDLSEVRYVDRESYNFLKKTSLYGGELLFLKRGDIGNVYLFEMKTKYATVAPNLYLLKLNDVSNSTYLYYYFKSNKGQKQLKSKNASSTLGALYKDDVKSIYVPIPPTLKEQKSIATALTDVDELITGLEKLISKKKDIKQGAMQQLLTPPHKGGKRLPGFEGEWVEKTLGEVADFYKGKGLPKSEIKDGGQYSCIHYGELFTKYTEIIDNVDSKTDKSEDCFISRSNDVLMPTSDVTPNGLATASSLFEDDIILGGDVLVIRPNEELYGAFLAFQVTTNRSQIMSLVSGTTVYHLYGSDVAKFKFMMPIQIEEQRAIVAILYDMDLEITQLETKKEKYQAIKQGMMQELLTGKTRLV